MLLEIKKKLLFTPPLSINCAYHLTPPLSINCAYHVRPKVYMNTLSIQVPM